MAAVSRQRETGIKHPMASTPALDQHSTDIHKEATNVAILRKVGYYFHFKTH